MIAVSITLAVFAAFWLFGVAFLALVKADTGDLRVVLSAPVVGSVVPVVPLFLLSYAGVGIGATALPVAVALVAVSAVILAWRRPRIPAMVAVVVAICLANLALLGRPMLEFGLNWVGNGNADMAAYVLSASQFMHHGLLGAVDWASIANHRDYATTTQVMHARGARPGADMMIAAVASLTHVLPYQIDMPLLLSLNLGTICAAAALAMQAARRRWAAPVAAGLLAAAPFAGFGVLQQLMPQVWGLGIAAVLFAWLMRREVHGHPGPSKADLGVISLLTSTFIIVYSELAASLFPAYVLYVAVLAVQRQIRLRSVALLWGVAVGVIVVLHNGYLPSEISYVRGQAANGTARAGGTTGGWAPLFGYSLIPAALPGAIGLQMLPASPGASLLVASIVIAIIALVGLVVYAVVGTKRGVAATTVLLTDIAFGFWLARNRSDFGVFKMYMYVQPFLAATVAVWLSSLQRRGILVIAGSLLAVLVAVQIPHADAYVNKARNPVDLHNGSSADLIPFFRHEVASTRLPIVSVTENETLGGIEASITGHRPLYFPSRTFLLDQTKSNEDFRLVGSDRPRIDRFHADRPSLRMLSGRSCVTMVPTGSQSVLNRLWLPEGMPDLAAERCGHYRRNLLIFITSDLGQAFYLPVDRRKVSFYQLEKDLVYRGRTMSGFGRYALFRVLNPTPSVRLLLDFTRTFRRDGRNAIPDASVVGATRQRLYAVGDGSARLISPPVRPQLVDGRPYVLLDMGTNGTLLPYPRRGIEGLWARDVPLDGRYLTGWVRDISLLDEREYRGLHSPSELRSFPGDLSDPGLEYSGIYEDGWIGTGSYVRLAGGPATDLVVRADVLPTRGAQHVELLVNGRVVASQPALAGILALGVHLPASATPRRIELRWRVARRLSALDPRPAAARLLYLGYAGGLQPLTRYPADLSSPRVDYAGISLDGWLAEDSYFMLRRGDAALLVLDATVPAGEGRQRLDLRVNGRLALSTAVQSGPFEVRLPLRASRVGRRVELRWSRDVRLPAPDTRRVAARLTRIRLLRPYVPAQLTVDDLSRPDLMYAGIYSDGWLESSSSMVLAGGKAGNMLLRAEVPPVRVDYLEVFVNGLRVAARSVASGHLSMQAWVPASRSARHVELRWSESVRLAPPDTRTAAARLLSIRVP